MKSLFNIFPLALILLFTMASCQKQVLVSQPMNAYTDATVWKDSGLVSLYVSGIYKGIPSEYDNYFSLLADITDEALSKQTFGTPVMVDNGQFNSSSSPYNSYWTSYYASIRQCNLLIQNASSVPASNGLRQRWLGEAHFLRALYYHYLHNYFGAFPIVNNVLTTSDNLFIPRAPDSACIRFIVSDLDSAAALLPVKYTGADIGRATQGAALALKCRVLLYNADYAGASAAAQQVMGLGYSLFADYAGLFYPQNDNNSEVIFDKQYVANISTGQYNNIDWANSPPNFSGKSTGVNDPTQDFVDLYEMTDGTPFSWSNPAEAAHPYANRDPRFEASIMHDSTVWQGKIVDMKPGSVFNPLNGPPSVTNYYMKKFVNPAYNYSSTTTMSGQNFILIRLAEVYLNYAEAQFQLGNTEEARKYVNLIRARPGVNMPPVSSASFTWDSYVHERRIELAFEGLRLWDINRWKQGPQYRGSDLHGITISGTSPRTYTPTVVAKGGTAMVFTDPRSYLFPVPQSEINKYPGQSLAQNPGW